MARPIKVGLGYYPADTNRRNDFKIVDLLSEYGPLGYTIYDFCLQYIYENGYYIEISPRNLTLSLVKDIGAKWIKNKELVGQVIDYCAEIGLFDKDLLQQNVITSVGIQRRYDSVTVRNKTDKTKHWLLDFQKENFKTACSNAPTNFVSATETPVIVTETPINVTEIPQRKVKKSKEKKRRERGALSAFGEFENVYLSQAELEQLRTKYPQTYDSKIEYFSRYLESTGKHYNNHYIKLDDWLEQDTAKTNASNNNGASYDIDELDKITPLDDFREF